MKQFLLTYSRWVIIFVLLSIPLLLPFLKQGYFPTHDGEWAVVRLADMYREIKDFQIPPRFSGNLNSGYGYPLFQFAYPLPYYLGIPFFLVFGGLVNSIKFLFVMSVPLSGLAMFFAARKFWRSDVAGLISGMFYMYLPYRMVDLYVRGSLGESLASVFFPLILYLIKSLTEKDSRIRSGLLGITFAGLILTHNLMAVLFAMIIGFYLIFLFFTKTKNIFSIISGLLLGAVLSMYFWLPALIEKQYIALSHVPIADRDLHFVSLQQLLFSPFGYGVPPDSDQFTYQIGLGFVVILILLVGHLFLKQHSKKKEVGEVVLFSLVALFFVIMMFSFAKPIWEYLPLLKEINYSWTSLLPLGFLLSLLGGYIYTHGKVFKILTILALIINVVSVIPHAKPKEFINRGDGFYFTNDATTTSSKEYMPLWVKEIPTVRPAQKVEVVKGEGSVTINSTKSQMLTFTVDMKTEGVVRLNTIYFPGWKWYANERELPISYHNSKGVMESRLSSGRYDITVVFSETPVRLVADIISLGGLGGITLIMLLGLKQRLISSKKNSR